ncbi:Zn-ribbon domain-containing OB-fold protein [Piscinibacter sp. HJYY11]|uniref:Zn-ribbon domain-containing OB-fold protein n=1 Tax=Piscinibacter sp. HJYY11 TaxID=2801333 RepID=UPI00191F600B|nr:hypothetical protein [Piscinibacter sp. HJYY11]MBL0730935.1 hypothetical protein [Piscinibacter sp. HJYY11]
MTTSPLMPAWGVDHLPTLLAHCRRCGTYTFPSNAWGCRECGDDTLDKVPMPQTPRLRNFITVYGDVAPGLTSPVVVGEVEIAPGVVEEALIAVADESQLKLDMPMEAIGADSADTQRGLRFRPLKAQR